jgi:chromosomal replication initiation ATPase DnaA
MFQFTDIEKAVSQEYHVHSEWLHQDCRKKEIVAARQMAMMFMHFNHTPTPAIATFFSRDNHTVEHAIRVMAFEIQSYSLVKEKAAKICAALGYNLDNLLRFCRMTPTK